MTNLERRIRKLELQIFSKDDRGVTWEEYCYYYGPRSKEHRGAQGELLDGPKSWGLIRRIQVKRALRRLPEILRARAAADAQTPPTEELK